jgi:transposase InsO family protein
VSIHKNARLTPAGRRRAVARVAAGEPVTAVAATLGVSRQTVYKSCRRTAHDAGAVDRSNRTGPRIGCRGTAASVGAACGSRSTTRSRFPPWSPSSGGKAWRASPSSSRPRASSATNETVRAVAWHAALGIAVERILTDNGSCYRARPFAETALSLGISQRFTRPYRPQTNGKAERFIRTPLSEWANARPYGRCCWRTRALTSSLSFYNTERRHSALGGRPPASRLPHLL